MPAVAFYLSCSTSEQYPARCRYSRKLCLRLFGRTANDLRCQDAQTPDNWLPRDPELIRLTGKHPLNCEGYLTPLFDAVSFLSRLFLAHVLRPG